MGVLLWVDSPGGSAEASDLIHREVVRVKEKKPVVAYFGEVAASGGYYVAAHANAIVAQPLGGVQRRQFGRDDDLDIRVAVLFLPFVQVVHRMAEAAVEFLVMRIHRPRRGQDQSVDALVEQASELLGLPGEAIRAACERLVQRGEVSPFLDHAFRVRGHHLA